MSLTNQFSITGSSLDIVQENSLIQNLQRLPLNATDMLDLIPINDSQTKELENLYTACIEWMLDRAPSALDRTNTMIDEHDKIVFEPALQVLMSLVSHSNNLVR